MTSKLRYGFRLCNTMYPKGTVVECLDYSHPLVQDIIFGIQQNADSKTVAIQLPGRDHATFITASELE